MITDMRTRQSGTEPPGPVATTPTGPGRPSGLTTTTVAGRGLQLAWVGFVIYGFWLSAVNPEHPTPPVWLDVLVSVMSISILAVTFGIVAQRRWALWGSLALALPMVSLAVMCFQAGVGNHWIAEAAFAGAIIVGSVHPGSWRMHTR